MGAAALIVGVTLLAYANSFSGPLVFDDSAAIKDNPSIRSLWSLSVFSPLPECPTAGRPLANFSFALNYALGGTAVRGYHAFNLLLHVLAALALFGIVRRTLERLATDSRLAGMAPRAHSGSLPAALLIGLLWSTHPLLTDAVTYISQRTEILMGLCYFFTLYAFVRGVESRSVAWLSAAVLACFAGMGSKEGMVTAPVLVLIYDRVFFAGGFLKAWTLRRGFYAALAASWLLLAVLLMTGLKHRGVGFGIGVTWWNYALTECYVVPKYLGLVFWPHPLVFDYGPLFTLTLSELLPACMVLVLLVVGAIAAFIRWPRAGFLPAAFFLLLAPTSSVVPVAAQPMAESRMYLPAAAIVALLVLGIRQCTGRRGTMGCAALAIPWLGLAVVRNDVYRDPALLWTDAIAKRPANPRAYQNLALVAEEQGRLDESRRIFETALRLKPDYDAAHNEFGRLLLRLGETASARSQLEEAIRLNPAIPEAHLNLGVALRRMGDVDGAIRQIQAALEARRAFPEAEYDLGNAFLQLGRTDQARIHFEAALRLRPDLAEAHNGLGNSFLREGNVDEAIRHYEWALQLRPGLADARENLDRVQAFLRGKQANPR